MRLIDADNLSKDLSFLYGDDGFVKNEESKKVLTTICEQPTAYDIEKVIKELDDASWQETDISTVIYTDEAIEIVKQGGVGKDVE